MRQHKPWAVLWNRSCDHKNSNRPGGKHKLPAWPFLTLSGHFGMWVTVWVRQLTHILTHTIFAKTKEKSPKIRRFQDFLELLPRFELGTSSLPITFCTFSILPVFCSLSPLSLAAQCFAVFSFLCFCLLTSAFLNLFGVPVWFLSGFLSAPLTSDLIPIRPKTRHRAAHLLSTPFYAILTLALPDSSGQPS